MPDVHAILSPSSAHRWMTCTPSARLAEGVVSPKTDASAEGEAAHLLGETLLRIYLYGETGIGDIKALGKQLKKCRRSRYYTADMEDLVIGYYDFVIEKFEEYRQTYPSAELRIEKQVSLDPFVPGAFGTTDVQIIAGPVVHIIDLKFGRSFVAAQDNPQLKLYALGSLAYAYMFEPVETIRTTIYQPRLHSISTAEYSIEELEEWTTFDLEPAVEMANAGKGPRVAGVHCKYCPVSAHCRANVEYVMSAGKYEEADPETLTLKQLAELLPHAEALKNWFTQITEYVKTRIILGDEVPGYKVVEGAGRRFYTDPEQVEAILRRLGYSDAEIFTQSLISPARAEKLLGPATYTLALAPVVNKTEGALSLVPWTHPKKAVKGMF